MTSDRSGMTLNDTPSACGPGLAAASTAANGGAGFSADLQSLRHAVTGNRAALCHALGLRPDGKRFYCPACQSDGRPHADGDFSTEAGFRCHKCGWTGDGFGLVQLVKGCDFPAAVEFVRGVYSVPATRSEKKKPLPKKSGLPTWETIEEAAAEFPRYSKKLRGATVAKIFESIDLNGRMNGAEVRYRMPNGSKECRPFKREAERWHSGAPEIWDLCGLPELPPDGPLCLPEGPKCRDALREIGLAAVATFGGANGWKKTNMKPIAGREIILMPDPDPAGESYASNMAKTLHGLGCRVRILRLSETGDVADWIEARNDGADPEHLRAELERMAAAAPLWEPPANLDLSQKPAAKSGDKPQVFLPGNGHTITKAAKSLGEKLAGLRTVFTRGGAIVKLTTDPDGGPILTEAAPASLASDFEAVADLAKLSAKGEVTSATCSESAARLIAAADVFKNALPEIRVLSPCPVLVERDGKLIEICGYDPESGVMASGEPVESVTLDEARVLLSEAIQDFQFATPADRARALASIVTPALVFGGLVRSMRPTLDLAEADDSQTGKGYKKKQTAAIYRQKVRTITQKKTGIGSLEESFNAALIRGQNFICFDNVRGRIDSPAIESFLTEDVYFARAAFSKNIEIDTRRICLMLTSNKADLTNDLANRCSCVRILKRPPEYRYKTYLEGDILEHIRAHQPRYLGAVFAVIRAWHEAGKPRTNETRHDFRPWAQTLDWITQNLLDAGPLLDGHRETQQRMTSPVLNWLRDVAREVLRAGQAGAWLRTSDIVEAIADTDTETPGLPEHGGDLTDSDTRKKAQQATGRKLRLCFKSGDVLELDGTTIERRAEYDGELRKDIREYRFESAPIENGGYRRTIGAGDGGNNAANTENSAETPFCAYETEICAYSAPMAAPNKSLSAPNAPDTSGKFIREIQNTDNDAIFPTIGGIRSIGATAPAKPTDSLFPEGWDLSL
jgi:5S rRNA maturation endonuclease (ribonuclease M5)